MALLEIIGLSQRYGNIEVLSDINLEIARGECFALIGPSGAGKTSLLRLIDLLALPAAGRLRFDGQDYPTRRRARLELRRRMAFVLQKPAVFDMSVYENIAGGLKWRGVKRQEIEKRVEPLLELVRLTGLRDRNARTLSGGEAQRVAIARALAVEPELLLLDEPTANLDRTATLKFEELIRDIYHRYQTTILIATHDLAQGRRLANRVGVLVGGRLVQLGQAEDIFGTPHNLEVAELVGVENILPGVLVANQGGVATVEIKGKSIEAVSDLAVGTEVYACLRPENVTLASSETTSSARNRLAGRVTRVVMAGPLAQVEIEGGFPLLALVTTRSVEELDLKAGKEVYASFKATAVHLIIR